MKQIATFHQWILSRITESKDIDNDISETIFSNALDSIIENGQMNVYGLQLVYDYDAFTIAKEQIDEINNQSTFGEIIVKMLTNGETLTYQNIKDETIHSITIQDIWDIIPTLPDDITQAIMYETDIIKESNALLQLIFFGEILYDINNTQ